MAISLAERDRQVVWHPFTPQKYSANPLAIVKGDGTYLIDMNGVKYIDAISSWWVTLHGHAHPYIAERIYQQAKTLEQVIFAGFTHEPAVELAERLLALLPGQLSKVFYSDDGSTSTEVAIKMSLQYWWNKGITHRSKILAFNNAYHGDTFGSMSVSDRSVFTLAFRDKLFEVIFIDPPQEKDPLPADIDWDNIACFIYEPLVQGAGGMKMYSPEALNNLLLACHKHDIICIADEVMTGFGRTGKWFASEYVQEKPDIICLSKGLTGGTMALGATACSSKIYEAFVDDDKLKTFFHGHSFTANPLACTAALASLDLLQKPECMAAITAITESHTHFLQQLTTHDSRLTSPNSRFTTHDSRLIKSPRQLGTILAFEVASGKDEYLNDISGIITKKALAKSVYFRPLGNTLYLMPPYCITGEQLNRVYEVIVEILNELK